MSAYVHKNVHSTYICRSSVWETTQMSINRQEDKPVMVYSHSLIIHKTIDETKWMNLTKILLNRRIQTQEYTSWVHFLKSSNLGQTNIEW